MLNRVIEMIEGQQKGQEDTPAFYVGEHLKDICRETPGAAELLVRDLAVPEMSIAKAEEKIKDCADKKKSKGKCVCVTFKESEKILREFYGLPMPGETAAPEIIDLNDFF